ncbi:MAG: hypothetical protein DSY40_01110 [Nautilia sp.]|nr:MAG: hypothetical protein DSY40_01110 [Nautilia sp.]
MDNELNAYKRLANKFQIVSKTDKNGIITYVNENFCKISGYSKNELLGKPHNIVRHPNMPKSVFKRMWETIQNREDWSGIIKNLSKNGETYYVKTMITPILDENNEIMEYLAIREDVTKLIKAEQKAQKNAKAKSIFLANMSHEIRTPLNAIIGFTKLLQKKELSSEVKHIIDILDASADSLLEIVNEILDFSKIEVEGLLLKPHKFNPQKSFTNLCNLFEAKAKEKNIDYRYFINLCNCIYADEYRLKQVISNLISNAIKFTPDSGKVEVEIRYKKIDDNNKHIKLFVSVRDSGIGIEPEKQKEILKPFSQADENISKNFGGTGLGLTIANKIIQAMGGELQIESEPNKGSRFFFEIETEICDEVIEKDNIEYESIYNEGKILLVEDNELNQELMKRILESKGNIKVTIADNGKIALDYFKNSRFNLVLMDIHMPEMMGDEAVKHMLEYEKKYSLKHTPIIALTANAMPGDKEKYLKMGFDGYIAKPIKEKELNYILNKYLNYKFDIDKVAENLKMDKETLKAIISIFFKNINKDIEYLENAIKEKDFIKIRNISHKIAGSSVSIRFYNVYEKAKEIEIAAIEKKDVDYEKLLNELKELIENRRRFID